MMVKLEQYTLDRTDREISATRFFNAPRDLVFEMWTDPNHIGRWWGPVGFTLTNHEMDVRPGGTWRFIMHGPDGVDYENENVYVEIVRPERIIFDHISGLRHQMTAIFEEEGNGTKLSIRMLFESTAILDKVVQQFNAVVGLGQTLDRLGETLATSHEFRNGGGG